MPPVIPCRGKSLKTHRAPINFDAGFVNRVVNQHERGVFQKNAKVPVPEELEEGADQVQFVIEFGVDDGASTQFSISESSCPFNACTGAGRNPAIV
jgi:hypothetical protein